MHHEIIGFPRNPVSRSGDPGRVIFYHENLKFIYLHSSAKETQLSTVLFFWDWVYNPQQLDTMCCLLSTISTLAVKLSMSAIFYPWVTVPTYGSTWVVLWLLFCRSAPATFPNKRFRESLVVRLYSEIDHLHLSSEAQCVSHLLPLKKYSKTLVRQLLLGFT